MNSRKSLLILVIVGVGLDEVEQDLEPLLRSQARVVLAISPIGVLEVVEDSDDALHVETLALDRSELHPDARIGSAASTRSPRRRVLHTQAGMTGWTRQACTPKLA